MMDKVHKPIDPECYKPLSEPFKFKSSYILYGLHAHSLRSLNRKYTRRVFTAC
jgi:hypothetical protein